MTTSLSPTWFVRLGAVLDQLPRGLCLERTRRRRIALCVAFTLVVLVQATTHLGAVWYGRPYENWDEIATYNNAYVLSGPTVDRTFRYGPLDTFMQWVAIVGYTYFDPVGRSYDHIRYSNLVPPTFSDRYLAFRDVWVGAYFRGSDDRQPIFLSRQVHLAFTYAIVLALGLYAISAYGQQALALLIPLLLLTVTPELYFQTTQSLPNAMNAVLAFGVALFAMVFCDQYRLRYLLVSVTCLAIGLNLKDDIIGVALAPVLALGLAWVQRGFGFTFRSGFLAVITFGAITVVTRPALLLAPIHDLIVRYGFVSQIGSTGNIREFIGPNVTMLANFLERVLWDGAGAVVGLLAIGGIIAAVLLWASWRRNTVALILVIGVVVTIAAWAAVVLKGPTIYERYFLNGLGALMAVVAMSLVAMERARGHWRSAARVAMAAMTFLYGLNAVTFGRDSLAIPAGYADYGGFDPAHHRNLASLEAARLAKESSGGIVLVDQHAYIDLRPLRLQGIDARYVNMFNLDEVIADLDPGLYPVVFARGSYNELTPWNGSWPADIRQRYDAYEARLLDLPVVRHYEGQPQPVLTIAPVRAEDEMFVSILTVPSRS